MPSTLLHLAQRNFEIIHGKKMKNPSVKNPHRIGSRFAYTWEMLPSEVGSLIDYGCFNGELLSSLKGVVKSLTGVDRNVEQIESAKQKIKGVYFSVVTDVRTNFQNSEFDAATCLEVMEHVPSEKNLIQELARILKPNGVLVLSVPHRGSLTFLDTGNFKFKFPSLVKYYYYFIKRDRSAYRQRFVEARNGMIGDVSISDNMEHKHYIFDEIEKILYPYFRIEKAVTYGFFTPIIDISKGIFCLIFGLKFLRPFFEYLDDFDKRFSYGNASYNIIVKCVRNSDVSTDH